MDGSVEGKGLDPRVKPFTAPSEDNIIASSLPPKQERKIKQKTYKGGYQTNKLRSHKTNVLPTKVSNKPHASPVSAGVWGTTFLGVKPPIHRAFEGRKRMQLSRIIKTRVR